jgi:hypothetical protein
MARKSPYMLKSAAKGLKDSWVAVGMDMSFTSIAATAIGWDAVLDKMTDVKWGEIRWTPEDDYFTRLGQAAKVHELVTDVIPGLWTIEPNRVCICVEEPFPLGMVARKTFTGSWIKQQCEVAGAAKGALVRYGWPNIYEINNAQWKATLRREGITIRKMPEGKWDVKTWAMAALGIPDMPDLVAGKEGGKIPRPESGWGAKAKAVQPSDVYDAAACMAWMQDEILSGRVW